MKKILMLATLIAGAALSSSTAFAQGRFYVGGSWGYAPPAPIRAYGPPPPVPRHYGYGYSYGYRPVAPGPNYAWIDGYYDYGYGGGYSWRQGYWAPRPHYRAVWVSPRYYRGSYYRGHWRR